jgi:uncharacterized membrane protein
VKVQFSLLFRLFHCVMLVLMYQRKVIKKLRWHKLTFLETLSFTLWEEVFENWSDENNILM